MVKRFILALLALVCALPAYAQSIPSGSIFHGFVTPIYPGPGEAPSHLSGTAPGDADQPADIATPSRSSFLVTGSTGSCVLNVDGGACEQAKMRTNANCFMTQRNDPLRNPRAPGASHLHQFCGNTKVNAYSNYQSLRTKSSSVSRGLDLNATAYWFPCPIITNPFGDGKNYCVRANYDNIYYVAGTNLGKTGQMHRLDRGMAYVTGTNMDDPDDSLVKREIALANVGQAGRYSYVTNGYTGWTCGGTPRSTYVQNSDGTEVFGGLCTNGSEIGVAINAPECWDGTNLVAPGGYKNFRQVIYDNVYATYVCPKNYYLLPQGQFGFFFTATGGGNDVKRWRLSSDDMMQTKLDSLPICDGTYSNAPCAESHRTIRKGESFHTDWMNGWDDETLLQWHANCLGIPSTGHASNQHECNAGAINDNEALLGVTTGNYGTGSAGAMFQVATETSGTKALHTH